MSATAIVLMVLFILIIWGGLVASVVMLNSTNDDISGELGDAPGTDDRALTASKR